MIHARPAEEQDHLAPPALALEELDERAPVLLVAVALRDDLADQDGVRTERAGARRELVVLDLGAEVVHLEALVALEPLVARVALVVEDRVDADGVRVAAGAGADDDDLAPEAS